jgi:hypothetical protein
MGMSFRERIRRSEFLEEAGGLERSENERLTEAGMGRASHTRSDDKTVSSWQPREPPIILNQLNTYFKEYCLQGCYDVYSGR